MAAQPNSNELAEPPNVISLARARELLETNNRIKAKAKKKAGGLAGGCGSRNDKRKSTSRD